MIFHLKLLSFILLALFGFCTIVSTSIDKFFKASAYAAVQENDNKGTKWGKPLTTLQDFNNAFIEIAKTANPSVVTVFCEKIVKSPNGLREFPFLNPFEEFFKGPRNFEQQPKEKEFHQRAFGSGVILSEDGYIITNNHVIKEADTIVVGGINDGIIPAKLIGTDPKSDIAVIKVEKNTLPVLALGDSDKLKVGEWVLAIGSPMGSNLAHTVTSGIVSAKGRSNVGLAEYEDFIQTDAAINPGNSGGALINLNGELIGINTAIATQTGGFQGIGFAIPINMVKQISGMLIEHGTVTRGWLGIYAQDINEDIAKALGLSITHGALINQITKAGPAEKAGLKEGDLIIAVNNKDVKNMSQLRNNIASILPGDKITIKFLRDNKETNVIVEIGKLESVSAIEAPSANFEDILGIHVVQFSNELARKYKQNKMFNGVIIIDMKAGSPAYNAGIREGDLIESINRQSIRTVEEFKQITGTLRKGDIVLFNVIRGDQHSFVAFKL